MVTHTVALFWLCPAANAFGSSVRATAIFGFGRSASWQRRSIIACSSGASFGSVTRARIDRSASLSPNSSCTIAKAAAITSTTTAPTPAAISAAMKTT